MGLIEIGLYDYKKLTTFSGIYKTAVSWILDVYRKTN
jgi:hypothetical protein